MSDDSGSEPTLSVDEFVEYCRTQAGLLSGHVETMREEADDLLDDIDADMAEIRSRLEAQSSGVNGTKTPSPTGATGAAGPNATDTDLEEIEALENDVEEKQFLVEAKQTRMAAFQQLAADYTELGAELQSDVTDGQEALERVIHFEADHDAPVYFEDRQTVYEAAVASSSDEPANGNGVTGGDARPDENG
ncbi:thioredoxin domain-containing protein [Natrialba asiatica]|uniref:Uncharacterized protein n=1 Tax=Natrialba asiatica (strain ATCC 700177 / DSM 12278 / JCM 9576 / FERM P-10747 / NBRC 102637 / 172P1) TaxID=29540 RepID=M0AYF5_NATA1|nr:hypothetical protein [Natrialba asiatica]ELZ03515.1 hypothetical protein C481_05100 [Natrialba asiatica DSM 12278]